MNLSQAFRQAGPRTRLYSVFGLLVVLSIALLPLPDSMRLYGLGVCLLLLPFALGMLGYVAWLDGRSDRALGLGTSYPGRGVLVGIPTSGTRLAVHLVLFAFVLNICIDGLLHDAPADAHAGNQLFAAAGTLVWGVSYLATFMAWAVVRRWGATPPPQVLVRFLLAFGLTAHAIGIPVTVALIRRLMQTGMAPELAQWLLFAVPVAVVAVVLSTWFRHVHVSGWQRRLDAESARAEQADLRRQVAEAQLAMLQAQIEPHFLYNTLASVQYLMHRDATGADFLLTQLIRYLRHAMPKLRQSVSTLGQEFELADAYLQIARMRMGQRLALTLTLPQDLAATSFPPLVLQTLVENAIKHGVEPQTGAVEIRVSARQTPQGLEVEVSDNGVGLAAAAREGEAKAPGSGTGLANIRERLRSIYGPRAQLSVASNAAGGVTATVTLHGLPLKLPTP